MSANQRIPDTINWYAWLAAYNLTCNRTPLFSASISHGNSDVLLLLYEFEAKAQSDHPLEELHDLVQRANALPQADAKTFETLAGLALHCSVTNINELAVSALDVSISRYTRSREIDLERCR